MIRKYAAAALLLLSWLPPVAGSNWTYSRCDKNGLISWGGMCSIGDNQTGGSPINLCGGQPFPGAAPTFNASGYDTPRLVQIFNNGHTVQIAMQDDRPTFQIGNLSAIVGRGTNASAHTWVLEQLHLHWGRPNKTDEGSEHFIQGVQYPLEAHLVHFNPLYGDSVQTAHDSGKPDALLVVGVLFEIGSADADIIKAMAGVVPQLTTTKKQLPGPVRVSDVFNGTGAYYSYAGSLTTPPCSEEATWIVMQARKTVTSATLAGIRLAAAHPPAATTTAAGKFRAQNDGASAPNRPEEEEEEAHIDFDFRPLQPLAGRIVYSSSGKTDACTPVHDAEFLCPVANKTKPKANGASPTAPATTLLVMVPALGLALLR